MLTPEQNIHSLLFDNDCVIIPDFGGFIKRTHPTVLDHLAHTIKPKGAMLFFNMALQQNDGLLANHIAAEKGITYQEALELLAQWVKNTEQQISFTGKFKFGHFGTFFVNAEGKKWFAPSPTLNFSKTTFGLETIVAKTIIQDSELKDKKEELIRAKYEKEVVQPTLLTAQKIKKKRLPLKIAASLILLVGVSAVLYFTVFENNNLGMFQQAQIIPALDSTPQVQEPEDVPSIQDITPEQDSGYSFQNNIVNSDSQTTESYTNTTTNIISNEITSESGVQNSVQSTTKDVDEILDEEGIYTILAGAFLHEDNAQRRMELLTQNGFDVHPVKPSNSRLTKIQCGKFSSIEDAEIQLKEVQKIIPQAHITSFK